MRKIVLLAMLVCTGTFAMAQNEAEQARDRVKALIKSGVTDITKLLPKHESEDEEDLDDDDGVSTTDPLAGKDEDFVRGYNDSRRKAYEEQKASFAEAGIDFRKTALGKLKQDSVGIFANIDNKLVAMKHIDFKEIERTGYTIRLKTRNLSHLKARLRHMHLLVARLFFAYISHMTETVFLNIMICSPATIP